MSITAGVMMAAAALGACASSPSGNSMNGKDKVANQNMVCVREMPRGSHIPKVTCMSKAQYEEMKKEQARAVQDFKDSLQRAESPQSNGGGGGE